MSYYKNEAKVDRIGDWMFYWRDYDIYGKKCKRTMNLLHKRQHWVGQVHFEKGKCICGEEIPGVILMHRLFELAKFMPD
jgi:hypothetical protein